MITIYIAVDIGKRNCVVCITDKDGSILEETKYENTLQEAWFASHLDKKYSNRKCHAVCESINFLQVQNFDKTQQYCHFLTI